jgi:hypothetical protein
MIRPIAICVVRKADSILVFEARDPVKDRVFYRPLGGGINFWEYGADAIVREMRVATTRARSGFRSPDGFLALLD